MEITTDLVELLPNTVEINYLTSDEPESNYIFKFAMKCLNEFVKNHHQKNLVTNYEEASYLIDSLIDKFWEKINIGHFSEISVKTRQIYTLANYFKLIFLLISSEETKQLEKCNEILDKAILIGCTDSIFVKSQEFLNKITNFLNDSLGKTNFIELPYIEPLEHLDLPCDIPIYDRPSIEFFNENCFELQKPALLKNTFNHWPALTKWRNLNYILRIAGYRTVPIEIGSNYTTDDWSQDLVKIKDFLIRQFGNNSNPKNIEYLAQHELFDQIPQLAKDIKIPEYCCLSKNKYYEDNVDIKAWLGPKGTISPLHQDPKHNILCQIFGCKKIILASFNDTENLYPHQTGFLNNTSQIDAENIDYDKFPLVKNVKFYHLTLQEGECLYIPSKWWHYVKSLSKSFSVSFWWE